MILVADSGATKCDWMFVSENEEPVKVSTIGFSPFFHSEAFITNNIKQSTEFKKRAELVDQIYYYGTGCSSKPRKAHMQRALKAVCSNASIYVDHDLNGAAYAACMGEEGIACILGTGSNACYFNGVGIEEGVPALGHRLGDEGSGSYFGRKLLSKYLYKRLPEYLQNKLENDYGLNKEIIFENVYSKPHENVYLASFMKSLSDFKEEKWVVDFIYSGLAEFADIHITSLPKHQEIPVNFVGSVAYYFQHILQRVSDDFGFTIGRIVKQPIYNLIEYHTQKKI